MRRSHSLVVPAKAEILAIRAGNNTRLIDKASTPDGRRGDWSTLPPSSIRPDYVHTCNMSLVHLLGVNNDFFFTLIYRAR